MMIFLCSQGRRKLLCSLGGRSFINVQAALTESENDLTFPLYVNHRTWSDGSFLIPGTTNVPLPQKGDLHCAASPSEKPAVIMMPIQVKPGNQSLSCCEHDNEAEAKG
jgi:hypothetical protein